MNQLNSRSEIERIKSKYYSMNLNNIINKKNYLKNNDLLINNKDNYNIQLSKDILEIKNKLELYRKEVKEISISNKSETKKESESFISKNELIDNEKMNNNISINNDIKSNLIDKENMKNRNIIENGSNQINIPNLNFKYNLEKDNNSRKEIEVEINNYENNNNKLDEIQTNNMNGLLSDIRINSNNQIFNSNNNDFDYSEVLPIIDKVSKLKDLNEIDDNYENHILNTQRINITNSNINSNEEPEVPNVVNSILDALSNKLITSNINEQDKEKENIIEKPKLITKNNNTEDKTKKIISFKEFLEKEEINKD